MATLTSTAPHARAQAVPPAAAPHAANPYDPRYDPLVSPAGRNQQYAPTYWVGTAGDPPPGDGPVLQDMDADVVVIGSGCWTNERVLGLGRLEAGGASSK